MLSNHHKSQYSSKNNSEVIGLLITYLKIAINFIKYWREYLRK